MGKQKYDATVKFGDDGSEETDTIEASSLDEAKAEITEEASEFNEMVGDPKAVTVESVKPHKG